MGRLGEGRVRGLTLEFPALKVEWCNWDEDEKKKVDARMRGCLFYPRVKKEAACITAASLCHAENILFVSLSTEICPRRYSLYVITLKVAYYPLPVILRGSFLSTKKRWGDILFDIKRISDDYLCSNHPTAVFTFFSLESRHHTV